MKKTRSPRYDQLILFRFSTLSPLHIFYAMASLITPQPWLVKIITSLQTRLLVTLEDPAATVGELRGKNGKTFQGCK